MRILPTTPGIVSLLGFILLCIWFGTPAQATETYARVVSAEGIVEIITPDRSIRSLNKGDRIPPGSRIELKENATLTAKLAPGLSIMMDQQAKVNLESISVQHTEGGNIARSAELNVAQGNALAIVENKGANYSQINLQTPEGIVKIRDGACKVSCAPGTSSQIQNIEGKTEFQQPQSSGAPITIAPGKALKLQAGSTQSGDQPQTQQTISNSEIRSIEKTVENVVTETSNNALQNTPDSKETTSKPVVEQLLLESPNPANVEGLIVSPF